MANHKTPSEKVQTEGIESVPGQNHRHEVSGTTSPDEAASPAQLDDPVESVPFSTIMAIVFMGMSYVPAISCGLVLVVRIPPRLELPLVTWRTLCGFREAGPWPRLSPLLRVV